MSLLRRDILLVVNDGAFRTAGGYVSTYHMIRSTFLIDRFILYRSTLSHAHKGVIVHPGSRPDTTAFRIQMTIRFPDCESEDVEVVRRQIEDGSEL